jgi:hypothetical protein
VDPVDLDTIHADGGEVRVAAILVGRRGDDTASIVPAPALGNQLAPHELRDGATGPAAADATGNILPARVLDLLLELGLVSEPLDAANMV